MGASALGQPGLLLTPALGVMAAVLLVLLQMAVTTCILLVGWP